MYGMLRRGGRDGPVISITKAAGGYVLLLPPKPDPKADTFHDPACEGDPKVLDMTAKQLVGAVRHAAGLGDGYDPDPEPEVHVCADLVAVMARVRECFEPDAAETS